MTAIDVIKDLMFKSDTTFSELAEYAELGTKENVYQMLKRKDLKVGTFVKMLETMGYRLIVENSETGTQESIVDYEEDESWNIH